MGEVWRAQDENLGMDVAVKLLLVPALPEQFEEAKARFDIEQRALVSLRSPYIVRVLDRGLTEQEQPYFVMELLAGHSLEDHLKEGERLKVLEVLEILEDLGRAIHEPHERGLAHRDIKPGNIFLLEYSGQRRLEVRLLDFGVAKSISAEAHDGSVTTAGMIVGTPLYIAPEQIDGTATLRSDIYSIGVVAYRCLAGHPPFVGDQPSVLRQHVSVPPGPFAAELKVPTDLEELIFRMLAKFPADRPRSAELVNEVIRIRSSYLESITPRSDGIRTSDLDLAPQSGSGVEPITRNFENSEIDIRTIGGGSRTLIITFLLLLIAGSIAAYLALREPPTQSASIVDPVSKSVAEDAGTSPDPRQEAPSMRAVRTDAGAESRQDVGATAARSDPAAPVPSRKPRRAQARSKPSRRRTPRAAAPPPSAPSKSRKTVLVGFRAATGVQILTLRINGKSYGSVPVRIPLARGSEIIIEYMGPDAVTKKRKERVPTAGGTFVLE